MNPSRSIEPWTPDEAISGRVVPAPVEGASEEDASTPPPFKLMPVRKIVWSNLKVLFKSAFTCIPVALVLTLLGWFFISILIDIFATISFPVVSVFRWIYVVLVGLNVLVLLLAMSIVAWRSLRQRTPFRLMYEAMIIYEMRSEPGFKQLTRAEIVSSVSLKRAIRGLSKALLGALLKGRFRRW